MVITITSLHYLFNPEYRLHLSNRMKRKRALLRSNLPGIIRSDTHIIRLWVYAHGGLFYAFLRFLRKPKATFAPPFFVGLSDNNSSIVF